MKIDDLQYVILKKKILKEPINIKIISGSMLPLIKIDEKIIVTNTDTSTLNRYDVIVYHADDQRLICHFIWGKSMVNQGSYLTQALSGGRLDSPVKESKILGIVQGKKISFFQKFIFTVKYLSSPH